MAGKEMAKWTNDASVLLGYFPDLKRNNECISYKHDSYCTSKISKKEKDDTGSIAGKC